jgi:hypothetical protein
VLLSWLAVYALFGDRLYVPREPGNAVRIGGVVTLLLVAAMLASHPRARAALLARLPRLPWLLAFAGLWALLSLAGPLAGYPVHTAFAATVPLSVAVLAGVGALLGGRAEAGDEWLFRSLAAVAWVQFVAGLMQALLYSGLVATAPQRWLQSWDTASAVDMGVRNIVGRSEGLYHNPNPYSLLGGMLLVLALTLPITRARRAVLAVPAAGIVFLGASRGVVLALLLLALPPVVRAFRTLDVRRRVTVAVGGLATAVGAHFLLAAVAGEMYLRVFRRWLTLPALLLRGAPGDVNVDARVGAWAKAVGFWAAHPIGSLGPPQMAISTFTDNDYITMLLQGGLLLLLAYAGTLASAYFWRRRSALHAALGPLVVLVAVSGLSQTSALYVPALALFWPAVGTIAAEAPGSDPPAAAEAT